MQDKLEQLKSYLLPLTRDGVTLAFSGGVDSSFLLAVLSGLRKEKDFPLAAFFARTAFQKQGEFEAAAERAARMGVELRGIALDVLAVPEVKNNSVQRCYHCKKRIFDAFHRAADETGLAHLLDGTNADDRKVYRPGLRALAEQNVLSPLAENGFTKAMIRRKASEMGLDFADAPSSPCLATRFAYDTPLALDKVRACGEGEAFLRGFLPPEADLRLRVHGDLARIEAGKTFLRSMLENGDAIAAGLRALGFRHITLDLEGFRSGSFDENAVPKKED